MSTIELFIIVGLLIVAGFVVPYVYNPGITAAMPTITKDCYGNSSDNASQLMNLGCVYNTHCIRWYFWCLT